MEILFTSSTGRATTLWLSTTARDDSALATDELARICHRRFGMGADGLMSLDPAPEGYDFEMHYYNSDGRLGSMCGNGGRCIAAFAHVLGMGKKLHFKGYDGPHDAEVEMWDPAQRVGIVSLGMRSVAAGDVRRCLDGWFLDTGSPHYVQRVDDLEHYDVVGEGRRLRNMGACGTGVTACALVSGNHRLVARGGDFSVDFDATRRSLSTMCVS